MESSLQQRIVGAIVLVALGVIFIPALLDGSGYKSRQVQDIEIKQKPEFPPLTQKEVKPIPTPLEQNKKNQLAVQQADPKQLQEQPVKAFALQVATLDDDEKAEKLRGEMLKAGYTAFVYKDTSKGKTSYKVRIGPELEYSVLEKIKMDVKQTQKIDGFIVNYP